MKLLRPGTWWVRSSLDPRWDGSGPAPAVGMFSMPREAAEHIESRRGELGDPPDDLEWGYMKD